MLAKFSGPGCMIGGDGVTPKKLHEYFAGLKKRFTLPTSSSTSLEIPAARKPYIRPRAVLPHLAILNSSATSLCAIAFLDIAASSYSILLNWTQLHYTRKLEVSLDKKRALQALRLKNPFGEWVRPYSPSPPPRQVHGGCHCTERFHAAVYRLSYLSAPRLRTLCEQFSVYREFCLPNAVQVPVTFQLYTHETAQGECWLIQSVLVQAGDRALD